MKNAPTCSPMFLGFYFVGLPAKFPAIFPDAKDQEKFTDEVFLKDCATLSQAVPGKYCMGALALWKRRAANGLVLNKGGRNARAPIPFFKISVREVKQTIYVYIYM